jgi:hypothetical protein
MIDLWQFYDVPTHVNVILVGGQHDGTILTLPEHTREWAMMNAREPGPVFDVLDIIQYVAPNVTYYRWAGNIRDDGTRVFVVIM